MKIMIINIFYNFGNGIIYTFYIILKYNSTSDYNIKKRN